MTTECLFRNLNGLCSIIDIYVNELEAHGKCSVRRLALRTMVSNHSAHKAIDYHDSGIVLPPKVAEYMVYGEGDHCRVGKCVIILSCMTYIVTIPRFH